MRQREVEYAPALPSTDRHQRGTVGRHQACQMGDVTPAGERFAKWRGKFESARPLRNHRRQGLSKRVCVKSLWKQSKANIQTGGQPPRIISYV